MCSRWAFAIPERSASFTEDLGVEMGWRSAARKASLGAISAIGVPLIAKFIEKWADRSGYLDDPTKGLQWALAKVAAITEFGFFYPTAFFLVGLAIGLWLDALLRRFGDEKEDALVLLGYDLRKFSDLIITRTESSRHRWPKSISDRAPDLQALLVRVESAGFSVPSENAVELDDDGTFLASYLKYLGTSLVNKQFPQARMAADHWVDKMEGRAAFLEKDI